MEDFSKWCEFKAVKSSLVVPISCSKPSTATNAPEPRQLITSLASVTCSAPFLTSLSTPGSTFESTRHGIFKLDRTFYAYQADEQHPVRKKSHGIHQPGIRRHRDTRSWQIFNNFGVFSGPRWMSRLLADQETVVPPTKLSMHLYGYNRIRWYE
jgi:hypothetical protein